MDYKEKFEDFINRMNGLLDEANKNGYTTVRVEDLENAFPELKESEDDRMRNVAINACKYMVDNFENSTKQYEDAISWLERQRGQKEIDYNEELKKCKANPLYFFDKYVKAKLKEQNPADKVGPKFKVGDWVVYHRNDSSTEIMNVYDIRDNRYYFNDNVHLSWSVKECDEKCHLWTLQDAKDGDVLYCKNDYGRVYIVMSKGINNRNNIDSYFRYNSSVGFDIDIPNVLSAKKDNITPATKEQRNLLFQKMKEAGYQWDSENKKLKKIEQEPSTNGTFVNVDEVREDFIQEVYRVLDADPTNDRANQIIDAFDHLPIVTVQKPAWSEEDDLMLNDIITCNERHCHLDAGNISWLKSIKYRVQPKSYWSEEDERMFTRIEEAIKSYYAPFSKDAEEMLNWFKPIKDRVQPQNFPVTDEELIKARNEAYNEALDKLEYHSDTPTFNDGWSAAIWYLKKRNVQRQNNWKPSDEQMKLLREVQAALLGKDCHNRFVNFMYELKRLKEE